MTEALRLDDVPRVPRGVRLRFDEVRGTHLLLAPERTFDLDAVAADVLGLVDGKRSVDDIIAALAKKYLEDRAVIERDVIGLLDELWRKRVLDR
ncbi:MAG: pyrroloquinoline quinone biosynthesis peptide chaperone PqqD [Methylobacterium sp.]|jgi:pyrroloquinoline-quinone synthase/pyrroloquinoline quinone biosynthesis protein D|nr:pyrroloquinoline quinone biosynthesis peptide chaperone PqqD [Methylobacterium sp.]MCA3607781.1 pyrroloquinoline quinone biosynthesis peptide chaperone PqqD [Methylobacterium sp.]MCA3609376.1 pyrroloquinoline quinone biosynthesis peptide chaperone PqqD [Methylobacterium sp.]MCA3613038.1 pyrroloquinoline quinone biosynthesis peptide chaperone PqqD [Methylobacterium sp.]MCA3614407.1 pyrroloquinoline quinone biosynthesis peptide chaperone PqqD [Methylobacterium sp.]